MPINRPQDPKRTITRTTVYDQEYFSSSQTNLYIGDVLIDEISGLMIRVQQAKRPIYGYASQLYDKVIKATVLVEGQFDINFKEAGYLFTVLNRFNRLRREQGSPLVSPFISSKNLGRPKVGGAKEEGELGVLTMTNIERILSLEGETGPLSKEQQIRYYQRLATLHNELSGFNNSQGALPAAEKEFEIFENRIWGSQKLDNVPRRTDDSAFDGFTIYVTFGDFNSNDRINHTAHRIDDIHLTGKSQFIMDDGSPVQETYTFLARNWV